MYTASFSSHLGLVCVKVLMDFRLRRDRIREAPDREIHRGDAQCSARGDLTLQDREGRMECSRGAFESYIAMKFAEGMLDHLGFAPSVSEYVYTWADLSSQCSPRTSL